ncbi:DUF4440 domain-containing protein [Marinicauda algicola]|uniref:DUF4440 domain-containing protein n=1 Tax=Marinicauda algicola TaxID=2029849 RepID=A0A4S2H2C3_9PROT|nr:DUF4440 domain-containing protein [Marinicauda algicola]TGY89623.1 DUF4440 domain-containing protein [Marinicauda algicola]
MKRIATLLIALAAGVSTSFAREEDPLLHNDMQSAHMTAEEREVWHVIERWNDAFARNAPEEYFSYVDPSIVVMTPASPYRVEGIHDDRQEFEFGIRIGTTRVSMFQEMLPLVRVFGDTALVTYFHRGYYGADGEGRSLNLKETTVLRRVDGEWKLIHIHVSQ